MEKLKDKTVVLGVTGSIAAYKMADVASELTKRGVNVETILTKNGSKIIRPIVFSTLTGNRCITKTFDKNVNYNVAHVALAKRADALLVAPATANVVAKLAHGIADDMLTTTALACQCPKLIAPAMNTAMYSNPVVKDNLETLKGYGWSVIEPDSGILACKDEGKGKLPKPEVLVDHILSAITSPKDLEGLRVLVTAGPTREPIDPVRFITNKSSGKMGYALAEAAARRGAEVTLVSGPVNLRPFPGIRLVPVITAQEMYEAVMELLEGQDIIVKAAAVADFTPTSTSEEKLKKSDGFDSVHLRPTNDILKAIGELKRDGQFLCGFSMETRDLLANSAKKLNEKRADLICANSIRSEGSGFGVDTNAISLISPQGVKSLGLMSKFDAANGIFDEILKLMEKN